MATGDDNCNCTCACTSNFLLKFWLAIIMTGPILIMFVVIFVFALVSNIIFGIYYSLVGWILEDSCCCCCCCCCSCNNSFADSMKFPWRPFRFFCGKIYSIFSNPLIVEGDVRIISNQRNI